MSNKPNCHKCKYRRSIPGDAHSCCVHPATGATDFMSALMQMASGRATQAVRELNIKANPHGIQSGWFYWPANFDPVWLISCDGFTARATEKEANKQ